MSERTAERHGRGHLRAVGAEEKEKETSKAKPKRPKHNDKDFVVSPHDEHGHSVQYSLRADKRYKAIAAKIVWSRAFPFQTDSDVYRWCLDNGMQKLEQIEPGMVQSDLAELAMIREMIYQGDMVDQFADAIDAMGKTIDKLLSKNLRPAAVKMVYQIRKRARMMHDHLLRKHFLDAIDTRFGHLFNGHSAGVTASMAEVNSEADDYLSEEAQWAWGKDESGDDEAESGPGYHEPDMDDSDEQEGLEG